ncbi:MAG TPA: hypothetical protein VEX13_02060 [Chloroflexia bacterium]|nr:hypothetical protein [Chloroflexia bacterium]
MNGLFGSTALEVALGLIFIYFLLSLICSSINEFLAGLLKWRARDLEMGIMNLLKDPSIATSVLSHPLVQSVSSGKSEAVLVRALAGITSGRVRKDFATKPSYIPKSSFALALLDTIAPLVDGPITSERLKAKAAELANKTGDENNDARALGKSLLLLLADSGNTGQIAIGVQDVLNLLQEIPDSPEKRRILALIAQLQSVDAIRNAIVPLGPGDVRSKILDLLNQTQAEFNAVRSRIEAWYDSAMEQVRGVYKRRVQIYLFVIALVVASLIGADSLNIVDALSTNGALRAAVIGDVGRATTPGGEFYLPIAGGQTSDDDPLSATSALTSTVVVTATGNTTSTTTTITLPSYSAVADELNRFGQLFGYDDFQRQWASEGNEGSRFSLLLWKIIGLLVTAFALSFGAPFWFDLLNKVANLRSGVKPDEKKASAPGA